MAASSGAPSTVAFCTISKLARLVTTMKPAEGSTRADVAALFRNPWALLAGWAHYLAFDLFIGGWQVRDAQRRRIPHPFVVPALVLTFLFGPAGLLLYLAIRRRFTDMHPLAYRT